VFEGLSERLGGIFKRLRQRGKLNEEDVDRFLREVRVALLEADVQVGVVRQFLEAIRARAIGSEVLESLTPAQQLIKIVRDEMVRLLGGSSNDLHLGGPPPASVMLVGLQGSGKTTTCGKLAYYLKRRGRQPLLVAADTRRPAAPEQLSVLGHQLGVAVYCPAPGEDAPAVCARAFSQAKRGGHDVLLVDTAGRWHVEETLMEELRALRERLRPEEILLVVDAMTGQEALRVAQEFDRWLNLSGVILTKLDGDARGGAALSMRAALGKPIKFVGTGEHLDALERFHPDRMASRILGMGDVLTLIERAETAIKAEEAQKLRERLLRDTFTLEDFREQLRQLQRLGPLEELLRMVPGMGKLKGLRMDERELVRMEAIINSMTPQERLNPSILNASRRRRIARGSGTKVEEVNRLIKTYLETKRLFKQLKRPRKGPTMLGRW